MCIIRHILLCAVLGSLVSGQQVSGDSDPTKGSFPKNSVRIHTIDSVRMLYKRLREATKKRQRVLILCELDTCAFSRAASRALKKLVKSDPRFDKVSLLKVKQDQTYFCRSVLKAKSFPAVYSVSANLKARKLRYDPSQDFSLEIFEEAEVFYDLKRAANPFEVIVGKARVVIRRYIILFADHPAFAALSLGLLLAALVSAWRLVDWLVDLLLPRPAEDLALEDSFKSQA